MIRRHLLFLLLLPLTLTIATAEEWCGVVRDAETGEGISTVQILLLRGESKVIRQTISREDGTFCLALPDSKSDLTVRAALIGYRAEVVRLDTLLAREGKEILLHRQDFKLPEVQVRARAIEQHGDTVSYRTSAFAQAMDTKLEDVLVRLPDVTVSADGMISYKGRSINRFYIENLDLLGSRYTLASRNIRPEDVASVQIYEHHEPIRLLREQSRSDRAALNVKLKESAKKRWLRDLSGAVGGWPPIGKVSGSLMNFQPRRQTILVAKGDNTGDDIIFETRVQNIGMGVVFNPYQLSGGPENLFAERKIYSTFFGRDRRRDNQTAFLSLNHLIALSDSETLRINLNGFHDRNRLREERESHYYDPALGSIDLRETTDYLSRRSATENELTYEQNGEELYLKDILSVRYHHLTTEDNAAVNGRPRTIDMLLPSLRLSNSLTAKKLLGGHLYTAALGIGYSSRPQEMTLAGETPYRLQSDDLTATLALESSFAIGHHQLSPQIRGGLESYGLRIGEQEQDPRKVHSKELTSDLSVEYRYQSNGLELKLTPAHSARLQDLPGGRQQHLLPGVSSSIRHDWMGGRTLLIYSFSTSRPELTAYFPHMIRVGLTDYREGITDQGVTRSHNLLLRQEGTAPWDLSYVLTGRGGHVTAPRIYSLSVREGKRIRSYLPLAHSALSGGLSVELSKYFSGPMITLKGTVGWDSSKGDTYQQGLMIPYRGSDLSYGASLNWMGSTLMTLEYGIESDRSRVHIGDRATDLITRSLEQTLRGTLLLGAHWGVSADLQHRYSSSPLYDPINQVFLDGKIYYTRDKLRLQIDLTNLTNVRSEYYRRTDGINSSSRRTTLRGREVLLTLTLKR